MALVALGWLWWRAWARLVAGDATALCVAGVALGDTVTGDAAALCVAGGHLATFTFASRGRRGTCSHRRSFCVAGVALSTSHLKYSTQKVSSHWPFVT